MVPKLISALKFSCVKKQRLFEFLLLYAESISMSWPFFRKAPVFPRRWKCVEQFWTFVLLALLIPVLSFPLFLDGIGHFWVYVHHIFRKSFHSLMVSASDRCNFTSRARAILFRSPIHRLGKPLMTSCFIMRGSLHALVTPSFMASITASNDSVRPWTITFWRRQHQESPSAGASGASSS